MNAEALDRDVCYRALRARDARFDGRFYTAVVSTGVFCRPICPARPPKLDNCLFVPSAAAAHRLGFRPCLRCRPEAAPGTAGWNGTRSTVSRALALIAEGAMEGGSVELLSNRLGVGERQLRRLFDRHVGASPIAVAQTHRILFAKQLVTETALPLSEVALASGFGSIRRFNDAFQRTYGRPPTAFRRVATSGAAPGISLELPFSPPHDVRATLRFLAARAIPGVEAVQGDRYLRTFRVGDARGVVEVRAAPGKNVLVATATMTHVTALSTLVSRLRRLFDLDADMNAVDEHLSRDPRLARRVRALPGVRVPGAWDPFELAARAVLGQQVSVAAAKTLAGRLVAAHGEPLSPGASAEGPSLLFPTPAALAECDLDRVGVPRARARTLRALAAAMVRDPELLRSHETLDETISKLVALPGIGPWTAQYIALRALREPDAFPASDLGLLRALETAKGRPTPAELSRIAEAWRPWRAYAAVRLWMA